MKKEETLFSLVIYNGHKILKFLIYIFFLDNDIKKEKIFKKSVVKINKFT